MLSSLLLALLLASAPDTATGPSASHLVREIQVAQEAGQVAAIEAGAWADMRRPESRLTLATLARLRRQFPLADSLYQTVIVDTLASPDIRRQASLGVAFVAFAQAQLGPADSMLTLLLPRLLSTGDSLSTARVLITLATIRSRTLGADTALALARRGLALVPPSDGRSQAQARCAFALLLTQTAFGDSVAPVVADGLERSRRSGSPLAEASCHQAQARDWIRRGKADSAILAFGRGAAAFRLGHDVTSAAGALQWQGYVLRLVGELGRAEVVLTEALRIADSTNAESVRGWSLLNLGFVHADVGDRARAIRDFALAEASMARQGDRWGLATVQIAEINAALLQGDTARARIRTDAVAREMDALGNPSYRPVALVTRVTLARLQRDWGGAADIARELAVLQQRPGGDWGGVSVEYVAAVIPLEAGQLREAERALAGMVVRKGEHWLHYAVLARQAEVDARLGQFDSAEARMRRAGTALDAWRASLSTRELRLGVLQVPFDMADPDLGVATVIAALVSAGRTAAAFDLAEARRARGLLDAVVRSRALQDAAHMPANTDGMAEPHSAAAIRAALIPGEAMVSFVTGQRNEPTTAFVITPHGLTAVVLAPADSLAPLIRRFRGLLEASAPDNALAARLGAAVMGPVVALLPATTTRLFISPDGPLNRLVFDAVRLDGHRLIERYETALLPAVSILPALRNRRRADHLQGVLAFGVPDAPKEADPAWRALPSLPEAIPEARLAARSAPHSRLLTGSAGSEAALRREATGDYSVLHLAAHAVVDEQVSARTALLLAPGDGEDGVVRMADVEAMGVGAALVVLSACRTAGGAILNGEGVLGLTSAFLAAGAHAVIATAWLANDSAAAGQMRQFYAVLGRGAPAGDALRRMKLAALASGSPPSVWALFTLTGDPAMALAAPAPRPVRWWLLGLLVPPAGYLLSRRRRKADSTVRPSRSEA